MIACEPRTELREANFTIIYTSSRAISEAIRAGKRPSLSRGELARWDHSPVNCGASSFSRADALSQRPDAMIVCASP